MTGSDQQNVLTLPIDIPEQLKNQLPPQKYSSILTTNLLVFSIYESVNKSISFFSLVFVNQCWRRHLTKDC